jgi:ATP-binding cassette, subfamily C (CFTR/MRP), member 4
MYAWEKPFSKIVSLARQKEIKVIRYVSWIRGILLSFIIFSSRVSTFTSLVMYALLGNVVTAQQAFVITAYYNVLRQTMTIFFPQAIGMLAETRVSVKRLEKYMMYGELDRDFQTVSRKSEKQKESEKTVNGNGATKLDPSILQVAGITMEKVSARWNVESSELTLSNINLRVQPTTTVAVIGKVGAGKSSLIQAILGELPIEAGHIQVNGIISYAAQEPWLFSGSIRQNILFGETMDKDRYKSVIKACSLTRDIELWPEGDKTVVGERGMSLSGGQKARINLARAVYRKADIYLLDDPLSAVDAHVGRHLFDSCIKDFLKDKLVILVTHQLQYLPTADQVLLMNHGIIEGVGTFESLRDSGLDFAKLLPKDEEVVDDERSLNRSISKTSKDSRTSKTRHDSVSSVTSKESSQTEAEDYVEQAQPEEKRAEGSSGLTYYKSYFNAAGGYLITIIVIMFFVLAQLSASLGDYFVSYWVSKEEERGTVPRNSLPSNETTNGTASFMDIIEDPDQPILEKAKKILEGVMYDRNIDIYIFSALTVGTVFITLSRSFMFFNVAMRASRSLHDAMFSGVTRASMYFFNTNPSGRILNRFSKDIGQIDEILPSIMIDVVQIFLSLAGIIVVVALVNPLFLIPTVIIAVIFFFLRSFYLKSSRNLKRMEATSKL